MKEYRGKLLMKIFKKIDNMVEELQLLTEAELQHINEYDTCEDVCQRMTEAEQYLRKAMYALQQASAAAELEDIQDEMQRSFDKLVE